VLLHDQDDAVREHFPRRLRGRPGAGRPDGGAPGEQEQDERGTDRSWSRAAGQ